MLVTQFARIFIQDPQGKQQPTFPKLESTMTEILIKHHTFRHILDRIKVNYIDGIKVN